MPTRNALLLSLQIDASIHLPWTPTPINFGVGRPIYMDVSVHVIRTLALNLFRRRLRFYLDTAVLLPQLPCPF